MTRLRLIVTLYNSPFGSWHFSVAENEPASSVNRREPLQEFGGPEGILPEQILRFQSAFFSPVKIPVEADDGEVVLFCCGILVGIVKVEVKPHGSIGDSGIFFRFKGENANSAGNDILIDKRKKFTEFTFPQVDHTKGVEGKIRDVQGSEIGAVKKVLHLLHP